MAAAEVHRTRIAFLACIRAYGKWSAIGLRRTNSLQSATTCRLTGLRSDIRYASPRDSEATPLRHRRYCSQAKPEYNKRYGTISEGPLENGRFRVKVPDPRLPMTVTILDLQPANLTKVGANTFLLATRAPFLSISRSVAAVCLGKRPSNCRPDSSLLACAIIRQLASQ